MSAPAPLCQPSTAEAFLTPDQIEVEGLRAELSARLARCTEKQQAFFHKVYSVGIENMDRSQLRNAVGLCARTLRKNAEPAALSQTEEGR